MPIAPVVSSSLPPSTHPTVTDNVLWFQNTTIHLVFARGEPSPAEATAVMRSTYEQYKDPIELTCLCANNKAVVTGTMERPQSTMSFREAVDRHPVTKGIYARALTVLSVSHGYYEPDALLAMRLSHEWMLCMSHVKHRRVYILYLPDSQEVMRPAVLLALAYNMLMLDRDATQGGLVPTAKLTNATLQHHWNRDAKTILGIASNMLKNAVRLMLDVPVSLNVCLDGVPSKVVDELLFHDCLVAFRTHLLAFSHDLLMRKTIGQLQDTPPAPLLRQGNETDSKKGADENVAKYQKHLKTALAAHMTDVMRFIDKHRAEIIRMPQMPFGSKPLVVFPPAPMPQMPTPAPTAPTTPVPFSFPPLSPAQQPVCFSPVTKQQPQQQQQFFAGSLAKQPLSVKVPHPPFVIPSSSSSSSSPLKAVPMPSSNPGLRIPIKFG